MTCNTLQAGRSGAVLLSEAELGSLKVSSGGASVSNEHAEVGKTLVIWCLTIALTPCDRGAEGP